MEYQLCRHTHDDGRPCGSAAAEHRDYCSYHLGYRVRQLRIAQHRARGERFDLKLPPLESMHAVQSALTQLSEALAADMIDLKRADRLMRLLTIASRNLLKADKWPAGIVHSDQPGPAVDLAAEYGLPADLDVDTPPELAFPRPALSRSVILSEERSDESKDPSIAMSSAPAFIRPDAPLKLRLIALGSYHSIRSCRYSAAVSSSNIFAMCSGPRVSIERSMAVSPRFTP